MCRKLRYRVGEAGSEVNERPLIDKLTRAKAGAEDDIGLPASKTKLTGAKFLEPNANRPQDDHASRRKQRFGEPVATNKEPTTNTSSNDEQKVKAEEIQDGINMDRGPPSNLY